MGAWCVSGSPFMNLSWLHSSSRITLAEHPESLSHSISISDGRKSILPFSHLCHERQPVIPSCQAATPTAPRSTSVVTVSRAGPPCQSQPSWGAIGSRLPPPGAFDVDSPGCAHTLSQRPRALPCCAFLRACGSSIPGHKTLVRWRGRQGGNDGEL